MPKPVLDVGGGSGVMSIALAKRNPHLAACVLDIAPVCRIAARNARRAGLSRRVRTQAGDIRPPLHRPVEHFTGSSFGLATRRDIVETVKAAGFHSVRARNVYREVWYITGVKAPPPSPSGKSARPRKPAAPSPASRNSG